MNQLNRALSRPLLAVLLTVMIAPALVAAQTVVKPGFNLFSAEQDVQIGQQSAQEANTKLPLLNDAEVNAYVNRIGQKLAAQAPGPKFNYQFHVVNTSDINAFALPGGFIYINRGVLENSRNEGEVAGVIAHEISHAALRHGTHQASKAYIAQAGISILGGLLGGHVGEGAAGIINAVGGFGLNALFLKYSRDLESQADISGAQIMTRAGYSAADMVGFFQTLSKVDQSKKTNFLSDHPAPPDRIARIQQEERAIGTPSSPVQNVAELNRVKSRLGGTASSRSNAVASSAAPSSRRRTTTKGTPAAAVRVEAPASALRTYTSANGVYSVSYPANWQAYPGDTGGVTFAPEGGAGTMNGRTEVIYGAMVNHYDPTGNVEGFGLRGNQAPANITMEDATNDLIGQLRNDNPNLQVVSGSTQRLQMPDGTALAASLRGKNSNTGMIERVTVLTRQLGDDHLVYLLFVTPDSDAAAYQPVLQSMASSLRISENHRH